MPCARGDGADHQPDLHDRPALRGPVGPGVAPRPAPPRRSGRRGPRAARRLPRARGDRVRRMARGGGQGAGRAGGARRRAAPRGRRSARDRGARAMNLLVFDTATPATVVGARTRDGTLVERRHDPEPGARPGHAEQLLALAQEALAEAGLEWGALDRIGVGVGPGTFPGLRIGVATARALAQGTGAELAAVSTLEALAWPLAGEARPVFAVLDARRGEAFVAAWRGRERLVAPRAVAPEVLAELVSAAGETPLALGDGAVRFRGRLEAAGAEVPDEDSA